MLRTATFSIALVCVLNWMPAWAASPPSETLLPSTTKGWLSVPSVEEFSKNFDATQLGRLASDPAMKPFLDDLGRQLEDKLHDAGVKLMITLGDLDSIDGGEVAVARLKPDAKDMMSHALALVVDTTKKEKEVATLLAKVDKNMLAKGSKKTLKKVGATNVITYTFPKKPAAKLPDTASYAQHGDTLLASDSEAVLVAMLGRFGGKATDSLGSIVAFKEVFLRVDKESGALKSQARWFIEPLGFAESTRAANGGRKKRGLDPLKVLAAQGFTALQGVGGNIHLATEKHELLHHTYVYAPADPGAAKGQKYKKAANILDFPNSDKLEAQEWVPADVSSYITLNVNVEKAFQHFGGLFDAFTDEGTWKDVLDGLSEDPAGPMVNIQREIIDHCAGRVSLISDYVEPIGPKSERLLAGIELKPGKEAEKAVIAAIAKLMKSEPDARKLEIDGHEVWEVTERVEEAEIPEINIDGPGFVKYEEGAEVAEVAGAAPPLKIAITVANGHVFIANGVDILQDVLKVRAPADQLRSCADYKKVHDELAALGSGLDSFRFFTRTDESIRVTYELIKDGKMPQSETLLGRTLNSMGAADRKKGEERKQAVDGKSLPDFSKTVKPFLGPAGVFTQSEENGWRITGCLIKTLATEEEAPKAEVAAE